MDSKLPSIPTFMGRRGENGSRGCWLSLEEAKARALGSETWWEIDLRGKTVDVRQYDKHGPKDKPFWLFENGDMYLGKWKDHSHYHQFPVEEGFGVTYFFNPEGRVYVGHFKDGFCHGYGKSMWLQSCHVWKQNDLPSSPIREQTGGSSRRTVGRPYIYIGCHQLDLEADLNATVTLKDGTTHVGPWEDGAPVGNWWTKHKMVTHRSKRIAAKRKRCLTEIDSNFSEISVTKVLRPEELPREVIEIHDSDDGISSPVSSCGLSSWASDVPLPLVGFSNSPVSQITTTTDAASVPPSNIATRPPTSIATSRGRTIAPTNNVSGFLGMNHHRFRFVRIPEGGPKRQVEVQANDLNMNGRGLLKTAIEKDKAELMGVFALTPQDAARIQNRTLMLDFQFSIGNGNDTITLTLREFKKSKVQTLTHGIQNPFVTEYTLVLRQPAVSRDEIFLDL